MKKSKKIFAALAAVFLLLLIYASYDISSRTTFPGSRPQLKERLEKQFAEDSVSVGQNDSASVVPKH